MIVLDNNVKNQRLVPALYECDTVGQLPPAGQTGRVAFLTIQNEIYYDNGTAWVQLIGGGSGGSGYVTLNTSPQYITATKEWDASQNFNGGIGIFKTARLNIGSSTVASVLQPQINLYNFLGNQLWTEKVDASGVLSFSNTSSVLTTELSQTGTFSLIGSATNLFRVGPSAGSTYKVEIDGGVNLGVGHNYRINGVTLHNPTNDTLPIFSSTTNTFIDSVLSQSGTVLTNSGSEVYTNTADNIIRISGASALTATKGRINVKANSGTIGTYYSVATINTANTSQQLLYFANSDETFFSGIGVRTFTNSTQIGLAFYTSNGLAPAQRMTIAENGFVGIGINKATTQLELSQDSASKPTTNTWTISSDERVKTDITPYTTGLNEILAINPVKYRYNGKAGYDPTQGGVGIIAQDIKDIIPETVSTYFKFLEEDDEKATELYNFNSHALTFVLINAVKELYLEIQTLKENG
jgi:hypothetical protein